MDTPEPTFVYTGTKALENMHEAVRYNNALLNLILKVETPRDGIVLDFGAGVGTFSRLMRERGYTPLCLEIDPNECAHLRADGFTVTEDITDVPNGSCDLIYTLNVLEHIDEHGKVLRELQKKLKPTGKLFLYVPAFQILYTDFDAMLGHFRRYEIQSTRVLLEESGYTIHDIRYYDTLGFLAAYVFKLLRAKPNQVTRGKIWFFDRIIFPWNRLTDPLFRHWFGKNIFAVCSATAEKKTDYIQNK